MLLALFLIVLLLMLLYLLLVPITINIDTASNSYYIRLPGLLKASVEPHKQELIRIKLKALFRNFYFYPLRKKAAKTSRQKRKPTRKRSGSFSIQKAMRLLRTFKVQQLRLDIDTGDCIKNAKLYPIVWVFNTRKSHVHINYQGKNQLALRMVNRPIFIIKSFINI